MNHKKIIVRIVCLLLMFVIAIGTIWNFSRQLQTALTQDTFQTLSNVSVDYNKAFLDRVSADVKMMKVLAGSLREMQDQETHEIMRILQNAVEDGGFTKMVACNAAGRTCSNDGIFRDVSQQNYFQKAMGGETEISAPLTSVVNGEECIVIAVPIQKDQTTIGVLFGVYPVAVAGAQLLDFTYYKDGYGFVVAPDGAIVLASDHTDKLLDEKNLFSFFEKTEFVDFSVAQLKAAMKNGESGSFAFTYHGERRFVSFTPSTVNDWYTFSLSSDALMRQQEKTTNQIVLKLLLTLILVSVLLFVWITRGNRRHNKELLAANHKYESLLSHINGGMVVATHGQTAADIIATYVSPGFTAMTGYTLEDIQKAYQGRYLDVIVAEDREEAFAKHLAQISTGNTYHVSYRIRKKDGEIRWVVDNGYLIEDADGLHNHSILTDITVMNQQAEALRMSENRFSIAINASSGALFEVDLKKQLYTHFENAQRIFGVSGETLLADTRRFSTLPFDEFVDGITTYFFHPEDQALAKRNMAVLISQSTASYEARLRRFDNSYIWVRIDLHLTLDEFGTPARLVGFMSDINDIKNQSALLESKVQTDPMTGLYNKIAMGTLSNKILTEGAAGRHALLVLDIDNFKGINDTLGHAFGDLVLVEVASKLKASFRNNDVVGRMGGDEFAVLMKNVDDTSSVLKKATELSAVFRQTYTGEKKDYTISCSIGIIMISGNYDSFESLYRKADAALYQAKQSGKDQFVLYREENAAQYPITSIRTNDEELQNLKASHNMEAQVFELLYTAKDFNISINMALAAIGQRYHVSRVAIFEHAEDGLTTSNIYEWCNEGVRAEIANLQKVALSAGKESVMASFDQDGLLYCNDVRELPPYLRHILESTGVHSTLKVLIANDEKIYGFIGFDECKEYRIWTAEEIEKLSFMAKILSVFLFKKKTEVALLENLHTRLKILDILPDYICVVNPETHSLVYANNKMQELLPKAHPGAFCFTTLRGGQNGPCETCLIERIKRGDTENLEIVSEDKKLRLAVKALSIHWSNDKKMVLLYGMVQPLELD